MLLTSHKPLRMLLGFLESCNLLSLKLFFKNRTRWKAYHGKVFRDYMSLASHDQWSCRTIDEIFPAMEDGLIQLQHLQGEGIYNPLDELGYLALVTKNIRPKKIFEIGTFRGRTALNFALNSPEDCAIYTLDLPPQNRDAQMQTTNAADAAIIAKSITGIDYRDRPASRKIVQLLGDSTTFDFTPYFGQIDLVFVDGAHHYDAVKSDTRNALRLIKPGGTILWHDFANYGDYNDVTRAVLDLIPGREVIQIDNSQLAYHRHQP